MRKIHWWIAETIFLVTTINYIYRQAHSVAAPFILEDLNLSNEQYNWIVSAFLLSYAITGRVYPYRVGARINQKTLRGVVSKGYTGQRKSWQDGRFECFIDFSFLITTFSL